MENENLRNVFENFNLEIEPKTKVGLIGYSGGGKSTLISLLMRFFDIEEGDGGIEIDGIDIRDVTQKSLRDSISYIPQDPILFHRSIRENIVYGKPDATEDETIEASKKACCFDFINELENKFDTLVGERGVKLSGGQRQRIAIARAILKNSPILILDEATSALDSITEKEIQIALKNLMENKTVIAIAHRLSTLNNMDRIIVLDKGKIIEDGTKDELLNIPNGLFKKMWDMQKDGIIEE
jgi:ATP-binding cassette subfamily B protein